MWRQRRHALTTRSQRKKTMSERTEACFDLKPKRLGAGTAYGTGAFLGWLVSDSRMLTALQTFGGPGGFALQVEEP